VLSAPGSLSAERVFTAGTGISTADAGAGSAFTVTIDNSAVATLTGSVFSGDVSFQAGLSGSLQALTDGTPYLRSGEGISVTTGSAGYVQISNTGVSERQRQSYFLAQSYSAGINVPVASTNFGVVSYDIGLIDVLLNGQLLHSGTSAQVTADPVERDYYVTGASSLNFAFEIEVHDVLDVMVYKVVS
jgi:hypothetical protein